MFDMLWHQLVSVIKTISFIDIIDMLVVAYLLYKAIQLIRETRAAQLLKGILALLLLYFFSQQLGLKTMSFLTESTLQIGVLALLVVFQPELRRALEQVGRTKISNFNVFNTASSEAEPDVVRIKNLISVLCDATASLSRQKIGALMVLERKTKLGEIIKTGTVIDSDPSMELIGNIFFPNSPLHDGALIIRNAKLYAAGCFLPLSENYEISKQLGTRHRAALGMSENSDAVVVVVSEETGVVSIARNGKIQRNFDNAALRSELEKELLTEKIGEKTERKGAFWRFKKK